MIRELPGIWRRLASMHTPCVVPRLQSECLHLNYMYKAIFDSSTDQRRIRKVICWELANLSNLVAFLKWVRNQLYAFQTGKQSALDVKESTFDAGLSV
jgi:hypothetical protein